MYDLVWQCKMSGNKCGAEMFQARKIMSQRDLLARRTNFGWFCRNLEDLPKSEFERVKDEYFDRGGQVTQCEPGPDHNSEPPRASFGTPTEFVELWFPALTGSRY